MDLREVEEAFRVLTLAEAPSTVFDGVGDRQQLYRKLVRTSLFATVERACPHAMRLCPTQVRAGIAAFLASTPIQTRRVRRIAAECVAWLCARHAAGKPVVPHALVELMAWEALEIDVTMAPDAHMPHVDVARVITTHAVALHPSARMLAVVHPVHRVDDDTDALPAPTATPTLLLAWRSGDHMTWQSIEAPLARALETLAHAQPAVMSFAMFDVDATQTARLWAQVIALVGRGCLLASTSPSG